MIATDIDVLRFPAARRTTLESLVAAQIDSVQLIQVTPFDDLPEAWQQKLTGIRNVLGGCLETSDDASKALECESIVGILGQAFGSVGGKAYWHCWNYKDGIYFDLMQRRWDEYNFEVNSYYKLFHGFDLTNGLYGKFSTVQRAERAVRKTYRDWYKQCPQSSPRHCW